jgi:putative N6-adenine-specific DNA methylase
MTNAQENFNMVAKTMAGLEPILAKELAILGAQNVEEQVRSVSFVGDLGFMYKANLNLRTALSILKPIAFFKVRNEKELYKKVYDINWPALFNLDQTFSVSSAVHSDQFKHSQYVAFKVKDAIVDRFRDDLNERPNVDKDEPNIRINVHVNRENVTISLDSSGDSLFKRGYRMETGNAPMNEVLAAGLIALAEWDKKSNFVDPMCGSGTILIEAAFIAMNVPPQFMRKQFSFMHWKDFDAELFKTIKDAGLKKMRDTNFKFIGYDLDKNMVSIAKRNIENVALEEFISVERKDFFTTEKPSGPTFVLFNPPYGERLSIDIDDFYKQIGDTLKQHYKGATAWLITADIDGLKRVGLKTSKRIPIQNGALECKFVKYDLYDGSKKAKYLSDTE